MFKLKVKDSEHKTYKEKLNLVETTEYQYVLTTEKEYVEDDKINIVFSAADIQKMNELLDLIVQGEEKYITGFNEFGQKRIEANNFHYFIVEGDDLYGVVHNAKVIVRMKLYEMEEYLSDKNFIRVSKYALVNIGKIEYIKPALNSKLDLLMMNGDHVEVNRGYYKSFKEALKI